MMKTQYILVDTEAAEGPTPYSGRMTEFGAVKSHDRSTFHGVFFNSSPDPENPARPVIVGERLVSFEEEMSRFTDWLNESAQRHVFVSDNPAFDFMWIADAFDRAGLVNPFGYSGRRIGDIYAGAMGDLRKASKWKKYRVTKHDHNPVNDALGNAEALDHIVTMFGLEGYPASG